MGKRFPRALRPPAFIEAVVYYSVPRADRMEQLLDLRRRYRETAGIHGLRWARFLAVREALVWVICVWGYRALLAAGAIDRLLGRLKSG